MLQLSNTVLIPKQWYVMYLADRQSAMLRKLDKITRSGQNELMTIQLTFLAQTLIRIFLIIVYANVCLYFVDTVLFDREFEIFNDLVFEAVLFIKLTIDLYCINQLGNYQGVAIINA